MIVLLTNVSGHTMNDLDTITGGVGTSAISAVGGARKDPLPYPFAHIGALVNSGTKTLPMRPSDFNYKAVPGLTHTPGTEWNMLIQASKVTLGYTAESSASL